MIYAYLNGDIVDRKILSISVDDFGFSRGNVVFELTRIYGKHPFKLDMHLSRLMKSIDICNIDQPYSKKDFKNMVQALIEKNNFPQSVIKIYITQGTPKSIGWSLEVGKNFDAKVILIHEPFKAFSDSFPAHEKYYKQGVAIATVDAERTQPEAKTTNYVNAIIASSAVATNGFEDILYINRQGEVTECSRSNIFFIKNGVLITPKTGVLVGVTRQVVLKLACENNIMVEERVVLKSEISSMDEAFMTGSTVELMPIKQIDDMHFDLSSFSVYKKLWQAFKVEISKV
ncbi:MAG: branched-chain amino acid aminotransferase [Alphaproteobacteria bacterium]|jgi:branched-chain amino acid aminotransferase